jgi:hypothetical protein
VQAGNARGNNRKRATQDHFFEVFIAALPWLEMRLFYDVGKIWQPERASARDTSVRVEGGGDESFTARTEQIHVPPEAGCPAKISEFTGSRGGSRTGPPQSFFKIIRASRAMQPSRMEKTRRGLISISRISGKSPRSWERRRSTSTTD